MSSPHLLLGTCVLLLASTAGASARPAPDARVIDEVLRGSGELVSRYVSARAVEHYLRARLALEQGAHARASEELALCAVYDTQSSWPSYARALEHHRRGARAEAERDVRMALQRNPVHAPSLRLWGELLLESGRLGRALSVLEQAVEAEPNSLEGLQLQTRALLQRGELTAAVSAAKRLDALVSGTVSASEASLAAGTFRGVGGALFKEQRAPEAIEFLQRALALEPSSSEGAEMLLKALEGQERWVEAAELAERVLERTPHDSHRIAQVTRLYLAAGMRDAASLHARRLLPVESPEQLSSLESEALVIFVAQVFASVGRGGEAASLVEEHLVRAPSRGLLLALSELYRQQGRGAEALYLLSAEHRADPGDLLLFWAYVQALEAAGRSRQALEAARRLLEQAPAHLEGAAFVERVSSLK